MAAKQTFTAALTALLNAEPFNQSAYEAFIQTEFAKQQARKDVAHAERAVRHGSSAPRQPAHTETPFWAIATGPAMAAKLNDPAFNIESFVEGVANQMLLNGQYADAV